MAGLSAGAGAAKEHGWTLREDQPHDDSAPLVDEPVPFGLQHSLHAIVYPEPGVQSA